MEKKGEIEAVILNQGVRNKEAAGGFRFQSDEPPLGMKVEFGKKKKAN